MTGIDNECHRSSGQEKNTIDGVVRKRSPGKRNTDRVERQGRVSLGADYGKGFGKKFLSMKIIILFL